MLALTFLLLFSSATAQAFPDFRTVIYGEDDRINIYEAKEASLVQLAKSSAAMVRNSDLEPIEPGAYLLHGEEQHLCKGEKFIEEKTYFRCSAVLVGKRTMLTAGHCVYNSDCKYIKFLFGMERATSAVWNNPKVVRDSQMYSCARVLESKAGYRGSPDFALVELDRDVEDIRPAKMAENFHVNVAEPVTMIGFPSGLVKKIAPGVARWESKESDPWLETNLDAFSGNSGSPVYSKNHELIGILVRGTTDSEDGESGSCRQIKRCSDHGCRGEFVYKLKDIAALIRSAR